MGKLASTPLEVLVHPALKKTGVTVPELAERVELQLATVQKILRGHLTLQVDVAIRMGCILGLPPKHLLAAAAAVKK